MTPGVCLRVCTAACSHVCITGHLCPGFPALRAGHREAVWPLPPHPHALFPGGGEGAPSETLGSRDWLGAFSPAPASSWPLPARPGCCLVSVSRKHTEGTGGQDPRGALSGPPRRPVCLTGSAVVSLSVSWARPQAERGGAGLMVLHELPCLPPLRSRRARDWGLCSSGDSRGRSGPVPSRMGRVLGGGGSWAEGQCVGWRGGCSTVLFGTAGKPPGTLFPREPELFASAGDCSGPPPPC